MDQKFSGVLLFCNEVRRQLGRKPVKALRKGKLSEPQRCVIAATINHAARKLVSVCDTVDLAYYPYTFIVELPEYVKSFMADFDNGALPELQGSGWFE